VGKKKVKDQEKKAEKKLKKELKASKKEALKALVPQGCKTKCCEKFKKSESKRCKRCPCFDLMKKVA